MKRWGWHWVLAMLWIACHSADSHAQTYHWFDGEGRARSSTDFEAVPRKAWPHMRCEISQAKALSGDRIQVEGGHPVRLIGVDAPSQDGVEGPEAATIARAALQSLIGKGPLTLRFDRRLKDEIFDTQAYVYCHGQLVNEQMISQGHARALRKPGAERLASRLERAQARARDKKLGVWKNSVPMKTRDTNRPFLGFSLGLYSAVEDFDYGPFIQEMKAIGARDLMLITPWFMATHESNSMLPKKGRSTRLVEVRKVIAQAKAAGFSITLMPIVLLDDAPKEKWRGNIKPADLDAWFSGYSEFILEFADLAEKTGTEVFVLGSELSSMEKHESHWRRIIADVKRRYQGQLSYSANWDHLETIRWWDQLHYAGMTGYHSLTKKKDPSVAELATAWGRIRDQLRRIGNKIQKPYFFSELGYASLDGINMNPWDYVSPEDVDFEEQADCYRAWISAWGRESGLYRGAFFYTWWRNGDQTDRREYSVHGKPAEAIIARWMKSLAR